MDDLQLLSDTLTRLQVNADFITNTTKDVFLVLIEIFHMSGEQLFQDEQYVWGNRNCGCAVAQVCFDSVVNNLPKKKCSTKLLPSIISLLEHVFVKLEELLNGNEIAAFQNISVNWFKSVENCVLHLTNVSALIISRINDLALSLFVNNNLPMRNASNLFISWTNVVNKLNYNKKKKIISNSSASFTSLYKLLLRCGDINVQTDLIKLIFAFIGFTKQTRNFISNLWFSQQQNENPRVLFNAISKTDFAREVRVFLNELNAQNTEAEISHHVKTITLSAARVGQNSVFSSSNNEAALVYFNMGTSRITLKHSSVQGKDDEELICINSEQVLQATLINKMYEVHFEVDQSLLEDDKCASLFENANEHKLVLNFCRSKETLNILNEALLSMFGNKYKVCSSPEAIYSQAVSSQPQTTQSSDSCRSLRKKLNDHIKAFDKDKSSSFKKGFFLQNPTLSDIEEETSRKIENKELYPKDIADSESSEADLMDVISLEDIDPLQNVTGLDNINEPMFIDSDVDDGITDESQNSLLTFPHNKDTTSVFIPESPVDYSDNDSVCDDELVINNSPKVSKGSRILPVKSSSSSIPISGNSASRSESYDGSNDDSDTFNAVTYSESYSLPEKKTFSSFLCSKPLIKAPKGSFAVPATTTNHLYDSHMLAASMGRNVSKGDRSIHQSIPRRLNIPGKKKSISNARFTDNSDRMKSRYVALSISQQHTAHTADTNYASQNKFAPTLKQRFENLSATEQIQDDPQHRSLANIINNLELHSNEGNVAGSLEQVTAFVETQSDNQHSPYGIINRETQSPVLKYLTKTNQWDVSSKASITTLQPKVSKTIVMLGKLCQEDHKHSESQIIEKQKSSKAVVESMEEHSVHTINTIDIEIEKSPKLNNLTKSDKSGIKDDREGIKKGMFSPKLPNVLSGDLCESTVLETVPNISYVQSQVLANDVYSKPREIPEKVKVQNNDGTQMQFKSTDASNNIKNISAIFQKTNDIKNQPSRSNKANVSTSANKTKTIPRVRKTLLGKMTDKDFNPTKSQITRKEKSSETLIGPVEEKNKQLFPNEIILFDNGMKSPKQNTVDKSDKSKFIKIKTLNLENKHSSTQKKRGRLQLQKSKLGNLDGLSRTSSCLKEIEVHSNIQSQAAANDVLAKPQEVSANTEIHESIESAVQKKSVPVLQEDKIDGIEKKPTISQNKDVQYNSKAMINLPVGDTVRDQFKNQTPLNNSSNEPQTECDNTVYVVREIQQKTTDTSMLQVDFSVGNIDYISTNVLIPQSSSEDDILVLGESHIEQVLLDNNVHQENKTYNSCENTQIEKQIRPDCQPAEESYVCKTKVSDNLTKQIDLNCMDDVNNQKHLNPSDLKSISKSRECKNVHDQNETFAVNLKPLDKVVIIDGYQTCADVSIEDPKSESPIKTKIVHSQSFLTPINNTSVNKANKFFKSKNKNSTPRNIVNVSQEIDNVTTEMRNKNSQPSVNRYQTCVDISIEDPKSESPNKTKIDQSQSLLTPISNTSVNKANKFFKSKDKNDSPRNVVNVSQEIDNVKTDMINKNSQPSVNRYQTCVDISIEDPKSESPNKTKIDQSKSLLTPIGNTSVNKANKFFKSKDKNDSPQNVVSVSQEIDNVATEMINKNSQPSLTSHHAIKKQNILFKSKAMSPENPALLNAEEENINVYKLADDNSTDSQKVKSIISHKISHNKDKVLNVGAVEEELISGVNIEFAIKEIANRNKKKASQKSMITQDQKTPELMKPMLRTSVKERDKTKKKVKQKNNVADKENTIPVEDDAFDLLRKTAATKCRKVPDHTVYDKVDGSDITTDQDFLSNESSTGAISEVVSAHGDLSAPTQLLQITYDVADEQINTVKQAMSPNERQDVEGYITSSSVITLTSTKSRSRTRLYSEQFYNEQLNSPFPPKENTGKSPTTSSYTIDHPCLKTVDTNIKKNIKIKRKPQTENVKAEDKVDQTPVPKYTGTNKNVSFSYKTTSKIMKTRKHGYEPDTDDEVGINKKRRKKPTNNNERKKRVTVTRCRPKRNAKKVNYNEEILNDSDIGIPENNILLETKLVESIKPVENDKQGGSKVMTTTVDRNKKPAIQVITSNPVKKNSSVTVTEDLFCNESIEELDIDTTTPKKIKPKRAKRALKFVSPVNCSGDSFKLNIEPESKIKEPAINISDEMDLDNVIDNFIYNEPDQVLAANDNSACDNICDMSNIPIVETLQDDIIDLTSTDMISIKEKSYELPNRSKDLVSQNLSQTADSQNIRCNILLSNPRKPFVKENSVIKEWIDSVSFDGASMTSMQLQVIHAEEVDKEQKVNEKNDPMYITCEPYLKVADKLAHSIVREKRSLSSAERQNNSNFSYIEQSNTPNFYLQNLNASSVSTTPDTKKCHLKNVVLSPESMKCNDNKPFKRLSSLSPNSKKRDYNTAFEEFVSLSLENKNNYNNTCGPFIDDENEELDDGIYKGTTGKKQKSTMVLDSFTLLDESVNFDITFEESDIQTEMRNIPQIYSSQESDITKETCSSIYSVMSVRPISPVSLMRTKFMESMNATFGNYADLPPESEIKNVLPKRLIVLSESSQEAGTPLKYRNITSRKCKLTSETMFENEIYNMLSLPNDTGVGTMSDLDLGFSETSSVQSTADFQSMSADISNSPSSVGSQSNYSIIFDTSDNKMIKHQQSLHKQIDQIKKIVEIGMMLPVKLLNVVKRENISIKKKYEIEKMVSDVVAKCKAIDSINVVEQINQIDKNLIKTCDVKFNYIIKKQISMIDKELKKSF